MDSFLLLPSSQNVPIKFDQYSGYITVDQIKDRRLFYWFVESQRDPANDPLLVWMNGGTHLPKFKKNIFVATREAYWHFSHPNGTKHLTLPLFAIRSWSIFIAWFLRGTWALPSPHHWWRTTDIEPSFLEPNCKHYLFGRYAPFCCWIEALVVQNKVIPSLFLPADQRANYFFKLNL